MYEIIFRGLNYFFCLGKCSVENDPHENTIRRVNNR